MKCHPLILRSSAPACLCIRVMNAATMHAGARCKWEVVSVIHYLFPVATDAGRSLEAFSGGSARCGGR